MNVSLTVLFKFKGQGFLPGHRHLDLLVIFGGIGVYRSHQFKRTEENSDPENVRLSHIQGNYARWI